MVKTKMYFEKYVFALRLGSDFSLDLSLLVQSVFLSILFLLQVRPQGTSLVDSQIFITWTGVRITTGVDDLTTLTWLGTLQTVTILTGLQTSPNDTLWVKWTLTTCLCTMDGTRTGRILTWFLTVWITLRWTFEITGWTVLRDTDIHFGAGYIFLHVFE